MTSRSAEIIGIDILITIILPPKSILLAIAFSPLSLHIVTANSVSIAIPVILSNTPKYSAFIPVLLLRFFSKFIIPIIYLDLRRL